MPFLLVYSMKFYSLELVRRSWRLLASWEFHSQQKIPRSFDDGKGPVGVRVLYLVPPFLAFLKYEWPAGSWPALVLNIRTSRYSLSKFGGSSLVYCWGFTLCYRENLNDYSCTLLTLCKWVSVRAASRLVSTGSDVLPQQASPSLTRFNIMATAYSKI